MTARGLTPAVIPAGKNTVSFEEFRSYIRRGPIIDEAFGADAKSADIHGIYPHMIQLDYVLPTIEREVGRERLPVVFEYFGTERGLKFWADVFDLVPGERESLGNVTIVKQTVMNRAILNLP